MLNRSDWPPGPWDGEPDHAEWTSRGLPCKLVRNDMGAWCGYAGIPHGHPLYYVSYGKLPDLEVHGGITFSGNISADGFWYLGFDCAHFGDLCPVTQMMHSHLQSPFDEILQSLAMTSTAIYRTFGYAQEQVEKLAEQLAEIL